eukprot:m.62071 g.62071  ORF g.62071 m.62071 type:complete len:208 (-) comp11479_c0_seq2:599-1222(-)
MSSPEGQRLEGVYRNMKNALLEFVESIHLFRSERQDDGGEMNQVAEDHSKVVCLHEGWLMKLGYKSGKWQKRWFRLSSRPFEDPVLVYLGDHNSVYEKGCIVIDYSSECLRVKPEDELDDAALHTGTTLKKPIPEYCIRVSSPFMSFSFCWLVVNSWYLCIRSNPLGNKELEGCFILLHSLLRRWKNGLRRLFMLSRKQYDWEKIME